LHLLADLLRECSGIQFAAQKYRQMLRASLVNTRINLWYPRIFERLCSSICDHAHDGDVGMSEPEWQDLQHSGIFEYVSPAWYDDNNLTGSCQPARVSLLIVAPDYFAVIGVKPELGRTFPPSDHSPGFTEEVVISDGLWKRTFGSDPNILGKSIRMDTDLYRIVGVMPPNFHDPGTSLRERNIEVWAATSF